MFKDQCETNDFTWKSIQWINSKPMWSGTLNTDLTECLIVTLICAYLRSQLKSKLWGQTVTSLHIDRT